MKTTPPSDPELDLTLPPACAATQQALVDGMEPETEHLKICSDCRSFQAFLPVLREGLAGLPSSAPSQEAVSLILSASLRDRRSRIRSQVVKAGLGVALAASILIAVVAMLQPGRDPQSEIAQKNPPAKVTAAANAPGLESTCPPLRDTILEARSSVVSNLQRTADETVESTLSWLAKPMVVPNPDPLQPLEPAVNSLSEVGREAAVSVQPLTDSTRRAVGLFWKDLPSID